MNLTNLKNLLVIAFLLSSCANQLPPGGGEEDREPPKVTIIYPKPNTLNFKDDRILIKFNEYVDRRSFQEALRISPQIKEEISFDWSGKEVEVNFPVPLRKTNPNKTFVVTINSALKDIRGNSLDRPITFAFSTGNKIDKGAINGKVYNNYNRVITLLAYDITENDYKFNPELKLADYISEAPSSGEYTLSNLAPGKYRVIAVDDEDRNLLYTSERENFGVLSYDIFLSDSVKNKVNFYMNKVSQPKLELNTKIFFKDSLDIVYSSIKNDSRRVVPEQSVFIFFNKFKPERTYFANSIRLKDEYGILTKLVFNWRNDSLVELFPPTNFENNKSYKLSFDLKINKDSLYSYLLNFKTASVNSFGILKGKIKTIQNNLVEDLTFKPTLIKLESADTSILQMIYSFEIRDTVFTINKILEGDYLLFASWDKNENGVYNFGNPMPFEYSEEFYVYPQTIRVKGGWAIENVLIDFTK
ncbi:MAG: Ig-like domain-containing protein [Ignavibacteria bacterium]